MTGPSVSWIACPPDKGRAASFFLVPAGPNLYDKGAVGNRQGRRASRDASTGSHAWPSTMLVLPM